MPFICCYIWAFVSAANHFDCDFSTVCQNVSHIWGYSSRYVTNGFCIFYNFNCIFIVKIIWLAFATKFLSMEGCSNIFVDMMSCYEFLKLKRVRVKIMCPCHFQLRTKSNALQFLNFRMLQTKSSDCILFTFVGF